jgi:outer membrane protein
MKNLLILAIAISMACSSQSVFAQGKGTAPAGGGVRIAVADLEKIAKELPEAREADQRLTEVRKKYVDTLQMMEAGFKEKFEKYQKGKAMMSADAQKKEEEELGNIQRQYGMYQEEKFGAQGELARMRDGLLKPILGKVQEAVAAVARDDKYNFVFDKASNMILFAEEKADITFKVIDHLKRGK